jgi:hypothetical protein
VDGLSCRLHLAAVTCCRALSVCRVEQQTPSPECYTHLHTRCCCLIVLASPSMGCSSHTAHMKPRGTPRQHCQLAHVAHYMNSTRHAAQTHTQTHARMYANVLLFPSNPDESALRPCDPSFYVNFTHMPAATPVGCVSVMPLCFTFYVYQYHMAAAATAEGSCLLRVWSGARCDHRLSNARKTHKDTDNFIRPINTQT